MNRSVNATALRRGRTEFTSEEDLGILNFVLSKFGSLDSEDHKISIKEWNLAAGKGLFGNHSGESARTRFIRVIQKNPEKYTSLYNANDKTQSSISGLRFYHSLFFSNVVL